MLEVGASRQDWWSPIHVRGQDLEASSMEVLRHLLFHVPGLTQRDKLFSPYWRDAGGPLQWAGCISHTSYSPFGEHLSHKGLRPGPCSLPVPWYEAALQPAQGRHLAEGRTMW
jgi:hypothetical protein